MGKIICFLKHCKKGFLLLIKEGKSGKQKENFLEKQQNNLSVVIGDSTKIQGHSVRTFSVRGL